MTLGMQSKFFNIFRKLNEVAHVPAKFDFVSEKGFSGFNPPLTG